MKILLIDNNTVHKRALAKSLNGHEVEVQIYQPGLKFHDTDKDLVILSGGGGEGQEITDLHEEDKLWYEDEMRFVRRTKKPVIGICMGHEIIANAHGAEVPQLSQLIYEYSPVYATKDGWEQFGKHSFSQSQAHSWYVPEPPKGFKVLARSSKGVEIMTNGRQIGAQFHPELGGTLSLENFVAILSN